MNRFPLRSEWLFVFLGKFRENAQRFYKKAASFVIRSIAKHSVTLADSVVKSGALEALVGCLSESDPSVKESSAWALSFIAKHNEELAECVADSGAISSLVLCLQEPEFNLKRTALSVITEIAKHSDALTKRVVESGALSFIAPMINLNDDLVKRQASLCLSQIARHSVEMAEEVVNQNIFPKIFTLLKSNDAFVQKNTAVCIREIAKHSPDLARYLCDAGATMALIEFIADTKGWIRLPGIVALGYLAGHAEQNAMSIIDSTGVPYLRDALVKEPDDKLKLFSAWALGLIGKHSNVHASKLAELNVPSYLLAAYKGAEDNEELRTKIKRSLKQILGKCTSLEALNPLISESPDNILVYVLRQYFKVLPKDPQGKKEFVLNGSLKSIQRSHLPPDSKLQQVVSEINGLFPKEIVQFYSPSYSDYIGMTLDNHQD